MTRRGTTIHLMTKDGIRLAGRLFGRGKVGVILAHGQEELAQQMWFPFASTLAGHGYSVLTFDFRGFCPGPPAGCSEGSLVPEKTWLDVEAGIHFLRARGISTIFLIGSSLGAHTVFWAASRPAVNVNGVAGLSTPQQGASSGYNLTKAVLHGVAEPKLFIAGSLEPIFADDARRMYRLAPRPKQLGLVQSSAHGWLLLSSADPETSHRVSSLIFDFLAFHR